MAKFTSKIDENGATRYFRDGIELEKGAILTEERINAHRNVYEKYCNYFTAYPDRFVDLITPSESNFSLFFYQRIFLRAIMRYPQVYVIAPRAFSKSFISILGMILQCIFIPGTKRFIAAPKKERNCSLSS